MSQHHFPVNEVNDQQVQRALQILTTEHFNLQTGRASTISESNGRLSIFLTTTSGSLIAIGFIAQTSHLGQEFRVLTLVLLPVLLFLGITTFARIRQSTREDGMYVAGINRIRHFYGEVMPEIGDYLVLSSHDDWKGIMESSGIHWTRWQPLLTVAFTVAVINGVIGGVLVALICGWFAGLPLALSVVLGLVGSVVVLGLEVRHTLGGIHRTQHRSPLFPTPPRSSGTPEQ